jgi:citrate lyase subunit beta/citryl-CoA lyase
VNLFLAGFRVSARVPEGASVLPLLETAFGSIDFQLDTGIDGEAEELLYARSPLVLASRVAGVLPPLDGVTAALDDPDRLADDVHRARRLGFGGKLCIHPRQIEAVNRGFSPSEAEVSWARRVVEAAETAGTGAFRVDGEMVDRPVLERAQSVLDSIEPPQR